MLQTEGSTYRKPGARLLVERNGKTLGVLSGGCLEEEIGRYGQGVIASGSPLLLSFDTRLLYGCDGRLKILVEPVPAAERNGNLITKIRDYPVDEALGSQIMLRKWTICGSFFARLGTKLGTLYSTAHLSRFCWQSLSS